MFTSLASAWGEQRVTGLGPLNTTKGMRLPLSFLPASAHNSTSGRLCKQYRTARFPDRVECQRAAYHMTADEVPPPPSNSHECMILFHSVIVHFIPEVCKYRFIISENECWRDCLVTIVESLDIYYFGSLSVLLEVYY